jgi:hypothetical protein
VRFKLEPKKLYFESDDDVEGYFYTTIAKQQVRLTLIDYTLNDRRRVKFVDDCMFEVVGTGVAISRCPSSRGKAS